MPITSTKTTSWKGEPNVKRINVYLRPLLLRLGARDPERELVSHRNIFL